MGRNPFSGFRVKHACGHITYYDRFLPHDEEERHPDHDALLRARLGKLEWLERHDCQSCHYKDEAKACLNGLSRLGVVLDTLPLLQGTEKQVSWAREIRAYKLEEITTEHGRFLTRLAADGRRGTVSASEARRRRRWCARSITWVVAQADAHWWIDQRTLPGWQLVRNAARVVQR